ncbi:GNAT family N-acetyltransferase [uncultured Ramlibacter sp.]|uniref:GNAT family N-acetyltransferase n=1 Tax=uncultured Ramlibacter sp. TaxID=260755 RepID=UPI002618DFFD|nr:GNAT family N-acetyltransferase [uncultured Ramlibacter sp.]
MSLSNLAQEVVELDGLNMAGHFIASNSLFDPSVRLAGLQREIAAGAKILEVRREAKLVAYLEYVPPLNGEFHIPSLQVHPRYKGTSVLRPLLAQAALRLRSWPDATLRTRVHTSNQASIRLHTRLGFSQVGALDDRVLFEISSSALCQSLAAYSSRLLPNP